MGNPFKPNVFKGAFILELMQKQKLTSLPICCIVSNLCVYTTMMCKQQKIKEKIRIHSNIKEPLMGKELPAMNNYT